MMKTKERTKPLPDYQGDAALARLLANAGKGAGLRCASPGAVRAVIKGVLAAPFDIDEHGWIELIARRPGAELSGQLLALKAAMAVAPNGPAPSLEKRLSLFRERLARARLDGFIIARADAHQGEYVPESEARLGWLTGFTGSAGLAVVMKDKAALFVDGRYTLQARGEVDTSRFTIHHVTPMPPTKWIAANLGRGVRLGFDPWLLTPRDVGRFEIACKAAGAALVRVARNPVDAIWTDRPAPPLSPARPLALRFTGRSSAEKRRDIAAGLAARGAHGAVLSAPDSIAWLLNIRGRDLEYAPLTLAFAIIARDRKVTLAIDPRKLTDAARRHLGPEVKLVPPEKFADALDRFGTRGRVVELDPAATPYWIAGRLKRAGAKVREGSDPCLAPKAAKNPVELKGIRASHQRDGAALVRFMAWFDREAPKGGLTEMEAAQRVDEFRAENTHFQGLSFPTISAAGPSGATVHYRATEETNRPIRPGDIYLLDSGAQYLDGTTDVTRTMLIPGAGRPKAEIAEIFTRVLKGNISLAMVRFPAGTSGSQLDVLARRALWEVGLEYDHGTGHGVGHFLNVHEGPQRISQFPNTVALEPGMILSNEPGFYRAGAFGMRTETLLAVKADGKGAGGRAMRAFETLTLAPIDRRLVKVGLLSEAERRWLNAYHKRVGKLLTPSLDGPTARWLARATAPL
jgi:Xaa-Pro aminopeptidase